MNDPKTKIEEIIQSIKVKFEKRIEEIKARGAKKIDDVQDDTPDPSQVEAILKVTFDVQWKTTSIKFDVPQFTMKTKAISFDIPEVKMELSSIKFDVPRTRMVLKCILKNPFGGCITKTKIPEVYMHTVEIKTDIPKVTSKTMEIKLDVPEIRMDTTEIKLNLPQFYMKSLDGQIKEQEKDIQAVSNEMTGGIAAAEADMKNSLKVNISAELENLFNEMIEEVLAKRESISAQYDNAVAQMKSSIKILKENNATAEVQRLEGQLDKIVKDYTTVVTQIDESIKQIGLQKQQALASLSFDEVTTTEGVNMAINPN
jgi:uncharacterized protein YdhG (YjbR/CyaY superfamily)